MLISLSRSAVDCLSGDRLKKTSLRGKTANEGISEINYVLHLLRLSYIIIIFIIIIIIIRVSGQ